MASALALLALPATSFAASCDDAEALPGAVSAKRFERATICLVNAERASHGLRTLRANKRLSRAARVHTKDMVRRQYFAHTSQSGGGVVERLRSAGYMRGARSWRVGENLAWGCGVLGTPRRLVVAWMRSPGHRANILTSKFRQIGMGVAFRAPRSMARAAATVTSTFGARS